MTPAEVASLAPEELGKRANELSEDESGALYAALLSRAWSPSDAEAFVRAAPHTFVRRLVSELKTFPPPLKKAVRDHAISDRELAPRYVRAAWHKWVGLSNADWTALDDETLRAVAETFAADLPWAATFVCRIPADRRARLQPSMPLVRELLALADDPDAPAPLFERSVADGFTAVFEAEPQTETFNDHGQGNAVLIAAYPAALRPRVLDIIRALPLEAPHALLSRSSMLAEIDRRPSLLT